MTFTEYGMLPREDYELTFTELRGAVLVQGPGETVEPDWDIEWRNHLVNQAEILIRQLWRVGVKDIISR